MRRVHVIPTTSLAELARALDALPADEGDLVLSHPAAGALVVGGNADIVATQEVFDELIVVAAAADPVAGARPGDDFLDELRSPSGALPHRSHPHPLGLCGPAGPLMKLLAACAGGPGDDGRRLTEAILSGDHDVALDVGGQLFRVLDGTGSDVVAVAGRLHAGAERPVVAIDPTGGDRLALLAEALADDGARDLAAILRYDGAAAPAGPMREAAPEILVMPFWTEAFCGSVIRAAEAAGIWSADPDDPVPGAEVSLFAISPRLAGLLDEDLTERVWPRLRRHWGEVAVTGIHDAFVIRYEAGGTSEGLGLHHDVAQVSASVRLNDGYAGGALSFPRQDWDAGSVPVGHLVVWPSLVTHPHRAEPVTRGVKYGLTIWFSLPES